MNCASFPAPHPLFRSCASEWAMLRCEEKRRLLRPDMSLGITTAAIKSAPTIRCWPSSAILARLIPFCINPTSTSDSNSPVKLPEPPKMLIPPRSTTVRTLRSKPVPTSARTELYRAAKSTAAHPASAPESTKALIRRRRTGTPLNAAAAGLAPMANSLRPQIVKCSMTKMINDAMPKATKDCGIKVEPMSPFPRATKDSGKLAIGLSSRITYASPRKEIRTR